MLLADNVKILLIKLHSALLIPLYPCFSIYFSSQCLKKATELTEEPLPAHSRSNIKLNTSIYLYFMYITCKKSTANFKLIDNPIILPDTSNVYGELCWLTWLQNQEACGMKQRLIVCMLSVMEWLVLHVSTRILIRTNKFKTANKTLLPLLIFISWNLWHPGVSQNPVWETLFWMNSYVSWLNFIPQYSLTEFC